VSGVNFIINYNFINEISHAFRFVYQLNLIVELVLHFVSFIAALLLRICMGEYLCE